MAKLWTGATLSLSSDLFSSMDTIDTALRKHTFTVDDIGIHVTLTTSLSAY